MTILLQTKQVAVDYAKDKMFIVLRFIPLRDQHRSLPIWYSSHCNALNPSFTRTPLISNFLAVEEVTKGLESLHPWGGLGEPEEVAKAAGFLASEDVSWIAGISLVIDGDAIAQ